jgi:putative MATE family efflux protein
MQIMLTSIVRFALPTLLVPMADPIMSLIDTISLGQWSGSLELAALGPCALIFNFAFYSFTALSIATVSLTAERLRLKNDDQNLAGQTIGAALFLGAAGGVVVAIILLVWGPALLLKTHCDPVLLPAAREYLKIRALAAPAAIVTQVAQAGLLGQRDSRTPFKIVALSIIASLIGDAWLIGGLGWGVAGAAWTTLASQYASATLLCVALGRSKAAPPLEFPSLKEIGELLQVAKNLGVFYVAKTSSYLVLQSNATRLPATLLAAHQPIWQLWGLASFANTPLEQAALAFIPASNSTSERKELVALIVALGGILGVLCSLVAHGVPALVPRLLTADAALWPHMQSIWLPGTIALLACGLDVSATGTFRKEGLNAIRN